MADDPLLPDAPAPHGAGDRAAVSGRPSGVTGGGWTWAFRIASALVILTLAALNASWWSNEAREAGRRRAEAAFWPGIDRLLEGASSVDVIALEPNPERKAPERFHGYNVLGRSTIRDPGVIKALAAACRKGREEGGGALLCFDPRHGLHVRHSGGELDLVICFECRQACLYLDSAEGRWHGISDSPRATFDEIFEGAGLKIAE